VSYSWVDPHFASLYARREDQRLTERMLAHGRACEERIPELGELAGEITWRRSGWLESKLHGTPNLRLT